jgi:predicted short-subunit dehydrogenase-like oxidoreductase (DUF2520 family)
MPSNFAIAGPRVAIAGAGRLGQALAHLLAARGVNVTAIAGRDRERTLDAAAFAGAGVQAVEWEQLPRYADHVLLTVPDDALGGAAARLARAGLHAGVVLHCSGATPAAALAALAEAGVARGVFHPLQTIPTREAGVLALPGAAYGVIAEGAAAEWALDLVDRLDGRALRIAAADQARYHAAAVLASNAITGLVDAAVMLMEKAGVAPTVALNALAPLVRAATENTLASGAARALTGPVERRDRGTVAAHLAALQDDAPIREVYRALGLQLCHLARRKHPGADYGEMEQLLEKGSLSK